jgi:GNAT superfamily N-acetyltransferase
MGWADLQGSGIGHFASATETARFGRTVRRVFVRQQAVAGDGQRLLALLVAAVEDVLIVRYPADRMDLGKYVSATQRAVIPAGSLVYWAAESAGLSADLPDGISVSSVAEWSGGAIAAKKLVLDIVARTFAEYGNHYCANPFFSRESALAGYLEWAAGTIDSTPHDVLVLCQFGTPVAVATCAAQSSGEFEVLLAGVLPEFQGQGLYRHLMGACAARAKACGHTRLIISTQTANFNVQRAWIGIGLKPYAAIETLHLNDSKSL